jgi:hypothetical protein
MKTLFLLFWDPCPGVSELRLCVDVGGPLHDARARACKLREGFTDLFCGCRVAGMYVSDWNWVCEQVYNQCRNMQLRKKTSAGYLNL